MTVAEVVPATTVADGWWVRGGAQIDDRPAAPCSLTIRPDGTWSARLATFTLAGEVDLFFISDEGGHFCGPASVKGSRAGSDTGMQTDLRGTGPLLVVAPGDARELADAEMVDGEVVEP